MRLSHYGGTVLYVSHDRYFINKTATRILDLTGKRMMNYIGNYDYYLEKHEAMMTAHFGTSSDGTAGKCRLREARRIRTRAQDRQERLIPARPPFLSSLFPPDAPAADGKLDWKAQKEEQARSEKAPERSERRWRPRSTSWRPGTERSTALLCDESVFTDVARLMELNKEKEDLAAKLEVLYEKWEELAE